MAIKIDRNAFVVLALVSWFVLCSPSLLPAQRRCCEGDTWMKWTEEHREDYVRGYILGYAEGYSEACHRATKDWPSPITLGNKNNPLSKCVKEMPNFSRGPEYFAKLVTELYDTYPQDRMLLITELLAELGSGRSIQAIHEHPPFPTHSSPPKRDSPQSP
jgi:hypothetical protein